MTAAADDRWDGARAQRWLQHAGALERQLAPVSELLFGRARLAPGETVLDVGCGSGPTTRHAAELVGPGGRVVGIDVSADMVDAARAESHGGAAPTYVHADVATWPGDGAPFDVVLSRFGVMFFDDPPAAFANLRRLTTRGGRMHVAVWATRPESELFEIPLDVARRLIVEEGGEPNVPPPDEGPFSLSDRRRVEDLLTGAGWSDVSWERAEVMLPVGGGTGPDGAAAASIDVGPTRLVLADADDARRERVRAAIARTYADHTAADGTVHLGGAVIVVSAHAGR